MRQSQFLPRPRFSLVPRVYAGCCESLLEEGPSRRYLCNLSQRVRTHTPAVSVVLTPVTSHRTTAFPEDAAGRHLAIPML